MLSGIAKRIYTSGPAGPAGATLAAALSDVVAPIKAALTAVDLPTARAKLGLAIGTSVQAWSATLDALSGLTTTALGRSLLTQADAPTALATLGAAPTSRQVVAGTGLAGGGDLTGDRTFALAGIASGSLLANAAAGPGATAPVGTTVSALLDANFGATRGTLVVRGAAGWAPLALGASGTTLQSNGTDVVFAAASPGTGSVRNDVAQNPSVAQAAQAQANVGVDGTETAVASAATTDIGATPTQCVAITGTTAITSLGTAAKRVRFIRFAGALTLTYDATKLILPTGTSITTAAGDTCVATSDASGNWTVRSYSRADGSPLALGGQSLANSGYKRLPGGVTIQWGRIANTNGDAAIAFPVAFSAAPYSIVGTAGSSGATATLYVFETNMSEVTASGFNARTRLASNGGTVAQAGLDATWFAVGPT